MGDRSSRLPIAVLIFSVCAMPILGCGREPAHINSSETVIDIGTLVADGSVSIRMITVENPFDNPLNLVAKWKCGCVRLEPSELSLGPNESKTAQVLVTPSASMDRIDSTIFLADRQTKDVIEQISVRGTVAPWLAFSSQVVQIGVPENDGSQNVSLTARNLRTRSFNGMVKIAGRAGDYVRVVSKGFNINATSSGIIELTAAYPGPTRIRGTMEILRGSNESPLLILPIVITGIPSIRMTPPSVVLTNDGSESVIKLARNDGKEFSLDDVLVDENAPVNIDRGIASNSAEHELRVRANSKTSSWQGTISVFTSTTEQTQAMAALPVLVEGRR